MLAEGVLVVAVGQPCTRMLKGFLAGEKSYSAIACLGQRTATGDATGEVVESAPWSHVSVDVIRGHSEAFQGELLQTPPLYSALRRNGKRLYEHARDGTASDIILEPRPVKVYEIDIAAASSVVCCGSGGSGGSSTTTTITTTTSSSRKPSTNANGWVDPQQVVCSVAQARAFDMSARFAGDATALSLPYFGLRARVGGGTYIRQLIEDIAVESGTVATMTDLIRTQQGPFHLHDCLPFESCLSMDHIAAQIAKFAHLLPPEVKEQSSDSSTL